MPDDGRGGGTAERRHPEPLQVGSDSAILAAIVRSTSDAIIGKQLDGTLTSWNEAARRMYGWSAEEVLGRNVRLIVPEDRWPELDDVNGRAARGEHVDYFLTQRVAKDGRVLDVSLSVSPIRSPDGAVVGISSIGRDVTDRLRETAAVQESEALKRAILEGALDAIVTIDEAGTVLEVNPAMCATFGWTAEQMVGHNVADLVIPEESRQAHRDGMAEYLRTGSSPLLGVRQDFTAQHADGHRLPVEVTIMPVDVGGRSMFTGYLRDMSSRRAAEAESERLNNRLQQTDRLDALGQLAGGIAHDFNNLLAVILNYAGLVRDDLPPGQSREDIDAISAAAQRAADLTQKLLTFSRGDTPAEAEADANVVVAGICEVLHRTLPETISVVSRLAPDAWPVHCDTTHLDQVVMNLAVNARDAMPDGGTLTVETRNEQLDDLAASARSPMRPGRYLRLMVTDSGTGMPKEVQDRAFDPFFTTKPAGQGTGLGLATVYGIARQMGGDVTIYSEPGAGTSVRVYLPVAERRSEARLPQQTVRHAHPRSSGREVLLVEDEDLLREALQRTLTGAGFSVRTAVSAEAALTGLADGLPDLLVTDVTLPAMSGPELAVQLQALVPDLPVLLMSGHAAHPVPAGLGPRVAMLDKPFAADSLLRSITGLLEAPDPQRG